MDINVCGRERAVETPGSTVVPRGAYQLRLGYVVPRTVYGMGGLDVVELLMDTLVQHCLGGPGGVGKCLVVDEDRARYLFRSDALSNTSGPAATAMKDRCERAE